MCVAISPCGKMIVYNSPGYRLQIWDTVHGKPMGEPLRGHYGSVLCMGFAKKSGIIVSGSKDLTIRRWRTVTSARINESTERCEGGVTNVVFNDN